MAGINWVQDKLIEMIDAKYSRLGKLEVDMLPEDIYFVEEEDEQEDMEAA